VLTERPQPASAAPAATCSGDRPLSPLAGGTPARPSGALTNPRRCSGVPVGSFLATGPPAQRLRGLPDRRTPPDRRPRTLVPPALLRSSLAPQRRAHGARDRLSQCRSEPPLAPATPTSRGKHRRATLPRLALRSEAPCTDGMRTAPVTAVAIPDCAGRQTPPTSTDRATAAPVATCSGDRPQAPPGADARPKLGDSPNHRLRRHGSQSAPSGRLATLRSYLAALRPGVRRSRTAPRPGTALRGPLDRRNKDRACHGPCAFRRAAHGKHRQAQHAGQRPRQPRLV